MNGYFQLINEEAVTSIMLYPATDGGEELDLAEAAEYLRAVDVEFNSADFYAAGRRIEKEPIKVQLCRKKTRAKHEMINIRVAGDNMSVTASFYAPSNDGVVMSKTEILTELKHKGVVFGIQDKVLDGFLKNREYCKEFEIALGQDKTPGQDARIEFQFNTDTKARPTLQEDGSVDFFHLNTINNCKKGDLLARLIPAVPPVSGMNVRGETIPGGDYKKKHLRYGKNVTINEAGDELHATVDGHIVLDGDRVSVSDVLYLNSVDNSTGNVDYIGSVEVAGNVCENFKVYAGGNVVVNGVVEGAEIEARGDVIITRGMNGMGKGKIMSGGNVIAKFFENAEVHAEGYIETDSILHSDINAGDCVHVGGKRGFITGGRICATNGVDVKNLGSNMGADTVIEIGANPAIKQRITDLQAELAEANKVVRQVRPILANATEKIRSGGALSPEQQEYIGGLYKLYNMNKNTLIDSGFQLDRLQKTLEQSKNAAVTVTGDAYAGTRIIIGDVSMVLKGKTSYCKFVKDRGDVRMKSL